MQALQLHWFWIPWPTGSALQKWPSRAISYRHSTINNSVWYVKYILLLRFSVIFNIFRLRRLSKDLSQHPPLKFSRVILACSGRSLKLISSLTGSWIVTLLSVREIYETKFTLRDSETLEKSLWVAAYVFSTVPFSTVICGKRRMSTSSMEREFVLACPALIWN